jgi:anaerobic magnesium-protoporphyrin IX monomethyl ester cyclase
LGHGNTPGSLTIEKINLMKEVGLSLINAGIETTDTGVARKNKQLLIQPEHQEKIIRYCAQKEIKICAFYILGLETDTVKTIASTLKYAIYLDTPIARFSVATPYPGTMFYDKLQKERKKLTTDYKKYSQFNLVFKHQTLTPLQVQKHLVKAYLYYYIDFRYIWMLCIYLYRKNKKNYDGS